MSRSTINSSDLIEEVKKRPCLYDNKNSHANPESKKAAWDSIGQALFGERWEIFSGQEKEAIVREMQVKWKSLRDNFSRCLKQQEQDELHGVPGAKRKKYIYFDALSFLGPYYTRKSSSNIVYITEETQDNDDSSYSMDDIKPLQNSISMDPIQTNVQPIQFFQMPQNSTISSQDSIAQGDENRTLTKILDEIVSLQKDEKTDDSMGNKKFLLSLLPFMRKLPDDVNLEVRLQLMSVLQTYSSGKSLF